MRSDEDSTDDRSNEEVLIWIWILTAIMCCGFHFVLAAGFFIGIAGARTVLAIDRAIEARRYSDRRGERET